MNRDEEDLVGGGPIPGGATDRRIERAMRWAVAKIEDPITTSAAAAQAHMSLSAFSRRFLQLHGLTFQQWLRSIRIERSVRLLRDLDRPVDEVAVRVGYSDSRSFRRAFKRIRGQTPTAFRRALVSFAGEGEY